MQMKISLSRVLAAGALALTATQGLAQAWPSKPIKMVVAFTPGSATDIVGRAVADKLAGALGQPVIVENRPGAGGTIGTNVVAKSDPDGYTLLVNGVGHTFNPSLYANLPFDTLRDIVGVTTLAGQPNVLVISPGTGFKTGKDLIAAAKARPGELNYASAGTGSGTHMNAEKFRMASGINAVHIPYKGTPEAMTDTMTGRVTFFFAPITAALGPVRDGKFVALGVSTITRSSALPNVPTVAESAGLKDFDFNLWVGLFAPAKTPRDIINKLNQETVRILNSADMKDRLVRIGADPMPMTPEQFDNYIREEIVVSAKIAAAAGIKPQ